jgi:hypothetical protein
VRPSGESAIPEGRHAPWALLGPMLGSHASEVSGDPHSGIESSWVAAPVARLKLNLAR